MGNMQHTLDKWIVNFKNKGWKFIVAILEYFINGKSVFINEFIAFVSYLCHHQILMFSIL